MRRIRLVVILVVLCLLAVLMLAAPAAAKPPAAVVFVSATVDPGGAWFDTGVTVTAGQDLDIRAHGHSKTGPLSQFPGAHSGPDGQPFICPDPGGPTTSCGLDGAPYGALIGEIGGTYFLIGGDFDGPAPASGALRLVINDNQGFSFDNGGGYAVQVRLGP